MAIYNPLYNEETGWATLDQLTPQQQAFMNPAAFGTGYNTSPMQMDMFSQIANQGSTLANPGGSNNFMGVPAPSANNMFGPSNNAAQPAPVIGSPSLATNMGMQGAENVGGVGMYTGSNGPLNMSLFAPNGADAAIMQGSMGGLGEMLYKAAQQGGLNPNTSYLGFIDDLSRRALAAKGGQGGLLPQDFVNYMNSQAGQQWFQGMRTPAALQPQTPGTPTGSPVIQQTGPQNPPVAPLPAQSEYGSIRVGVQTPGYNPNYGGPQVDPAQTRYGQAPIQNFPGYNPQPLPGAFPFGDPRATTGGMYDALYGQGAYQRMQDQERMQQDQMLASVGLRRGTPQDPGYYMDNFQDLRLDPLGIGIDTRGIVMADGSKVNWQQLTQQYGANKFGGNTRFKPQQQPSYDQNPYRTDQQTPVIGSPGMINQRGTVSPNDPVNSPEAVQERLAWAARQQQQSQPDWNSLTDYGRQQLGMPTAAQWAQMQGGQQAQPQYGQQQDFRAATYGTQPQTPAPAGGSGSIPNTTNPLNPLTSQQQYAAPGWGSATNRRSGFGNTSLFGTSYGSGGSTGFGGTSPSQFRGAGIYGRPASYGQSQRPY